MTYNFDSETEISFTFDCGKVYETVTDIVTDIEGCPYETEVSLLIVNDESIKEINNNNRGIDRATDVLSFPMHQYLAPADFTDVEEDPDAFNPESGELILGDIVLSIDRIIAQANEYGHSIMREYAFLICHSLLHLIGYDHMEEEDRILMEDRQKVIMDKVAEIYPDTRVE